MPRAAKVVWVQASACSEGHIIAGANVRLVWEKGAWREHCRRCRNALVVAAYSTERARAPKRKHRKAGSKTCRRCKRLIAGANAAKTRRKPDGTYYVTCRSCKNELLWLKAIERRL